MSSNTLKVVSLRSNSLLGKYVAVYGYEVLKDKASNVEFLYDDALPTFERIPHEKRKNIKIIVLGTGSHILPFLHNGKTVNITVRIVEDKYPDQIVYNNRTLDILSTLELSIDPDKQIDHDITYDSQHSIIFSFIESAKAHVETMMKKYSNDTGRVKRYIYNEKYEEWEVLNVSPSRHFDTIFLGKEQKQNLVKFVRDFVDPDVREEYRLYNVPYKANILLYGDPGTGKSSSILAMATEIKSDIAIIQFTSSMNDTKVFKAINSLSSMEKCKIVVMEDIDSLFMNRMENDTSKCSISMSGLLNAMDGLSRVEGVIVVMTTNHIECLDHALLRPGRVDLMVKFTFATEEQVHEMFHAYFKQHTHLYKEFYEKIKHKNISTSMLQQYFFTNRKVPEKLLENIKILYELAREKGCKVFKSLQNGADNNSTSTMYN